MGFALLEPVLKELGLDQDPQRIAELKKLADAMQVEQDKMLRTVVRERAKNLPDLLQQLQAKYDPDLKKVLNAQQYQRLREVHWQCEGPHALYDPDVAKALEIKPEQLEKIDSLNAEMNKQVRSLMNPAGGLTPESEADARQKIRAVAAERDRKVNEVLSKEQQDKFAELKGKPFDVTLLHSVPKPEKPVKKGAD